jgi:hypothetical protein
MGIVDHCILETQIDGAFSAGADHAEHCLDQHLPRPWHPLLELSELTLPGLSELDSQATNEPTFIERVEEVPSEPGA